MLAEKVAEWLSEVAERTPKNALAVGTFVYTAFYLLSLAHVVDCTVGFARKVIRRLADAVDGLKNIRHSRHQTEGNPRKD